MNDIDKVGIVFADPVRSVRAVEPRLGRIKGGDPPNVSESRPLDRSPDVSGDVRAEAVANEVDVSRV